MQQYKNLMRRCITLAKKGIGKTSPNPLVGCVIVDDDFNIISTGYHKKYGDNHAERDALLKVGNAKGLTLIVNLEPCSHFGKTPPCADFIIEKGIKRVVYGMKDVNRIVAGNGLKKLERAGIEIIGPVLEDECKKLNEVFIKNKTQAKTFVALKTATTIDGKIATYCNDSKWITSDKARKEVRNIRKKYDAILTSSSTVIADNPTMKHTKKIVLDRELKTNFNSIIYKHGEIIVFHDKEIKAPTNSKIKFIGVSVKDNKLDIKEILDKIFELGIMSVLVEAGGKLNNTLLPSVDKLYHFIAPKILGDNNGKSCFYGSKISKISECIDLKFVNMKVYKPDIMLVYDKSTNNN